jgi:hypothetical protein
VKFVLSPSFNINNAPKKFSGEETFDRSDDEERILYKKRQRAVMSEYRKINGGGTLRKQVIDIPNLNPHMSEEGK